MRGKVLIFPVLALTACAQPFEGRVANRLADAGLSRPMADCMAKRWVDRLSLAQLQKISGVAEDLRKERSQGKLTVGRFVERVRAVDDPEVFEVVSSSAAACALTL
jgi:hypothetical protein